MTNVVPGVRQEGPRARGAILEAATSLLLERGFAALTIEGIAARAEVSKQTIYRWWPSKVEILIDAYFENARVDMPLPDTGSLTEDMRVSLIEMTAFMERLAGGAIMRALIGQAQLDRATADLFRERCVEPSRAYAALPLRRAVERGELPEHADVEGLLDGMYSVIFHRVMITSQPVERSLIDLLVDHALPAMVAAENARLAG